MLSNKPATKMKYLFLKSLSLFFMFAFFASCTVMEPHPSNEILSADGLKIVLEWKTGSSSLQALEDVDLDLFLIRGANQVRRSKTSDHFEMVILEDVFSDGEYTVAVASHEIIKKTAFTVYISDMNAERVVSYTSDFEIGEDDQIVNFVKIHKLGTKYTVTEI